LWTGTGFAADVAITSVGQSPDGMMVKVLMRKLGIEPDYDAMMKSDALKDQKVLIAVVGGSSKGLGAAGIDKEEERKRAVTLIGDAKEKNIKVLVMHVGGEGRRGELSDLFARAVAPLGERVIVVKSGNADNLFGATKAQDADLIEVENIQAAVTPLEATLKEWGIVQ
jgi:dihydropteroate synthase